MTFTAHFKTLVKKNFIRWKRGWFGSLSELVIPIGIIALLLIVYDTDEIEHTYNQSYLDNWYSLRTLDAEFIKFPTWMIEDDDDEFIWNTIWNE